MNVYVPRPVLVAVLFLLLAIPLANEWIPIDYLFEAPFSLHALWFPKAYVATYFLVLAIYPLLWGIVLYRFIHTALPHRKKTAAWLIALQSISLVSLLQTEGFRPVAVYLLPVPLTLAFFCFFPSPLFFKRVMRFTMRIPAKVSGIALFVGYIGLSLFFKKGHPFSEYTMFNRFPDHTTAFLLRDSKNKTIPLKEYCQYSGNELFEQYVALNQKHGFSYSNADSLPNEQNIIYSEMLQQIFSHLKKKLPSDSVRLIRVDFSLNGTKPIMHERQVKVCPTP